MDSNPFDRILEELPLDPVSPGCNSNKHEILGKSNLFCSARKAPHKTVTPDVAEVCQSEHILWAWWRICSFPLALFDCGHNSYKIFVELVLVVVHAIQEHPLTSTTDAEPLLWNWLFLTVLGRQIGCWRLGGLIWNTLKRRPILKLAWGSSTNCKVRCWSSVGLPSRLASGRDSIHTQYFSWVPLPDWPLNKGQFIF